MKLACMSAAQLLQRRKAGLSAAEGLRLEDHLSGCSHCHTQANLLEGLSQLSGADFSPLPNSARLRAVSAALSAATRGKARPRTAVRRSFILPFMAAGAAAALAGWLVLRGPVRPEPQALAVASAPEEAQSRVLSGEISLSGTTRTPGQSLLAQAHMHTRQGAVVQLGHATVELRAETTAAWDASARTLELASGSVMLEVDPSKHRAFAVSTPQFLVRVLGTRFEVTAERVRVFRGRVSVQPTAAGPVRILDASSGDTEYNVPSHAEPERHTAVETPESPDGNAARPKPRPSETAAELLERARMQLANHALTEARHTLKLALARRGSSSERAEALSLQAETRLLAGDYAAARDGYLRVVAQLPNEPAAATALYAAARIEDEHGQPKRARALLARYLARYPNGSFVREAERRARALAEAPR